MTVHCDGFRFPCDSTAPPPRPGVSQRWRLLQGQTESSLQQKQRRAGTGEDQGADRSGGICGQGAGGALFVEEIQSHEETLLRGMKPKVEGQISKKTKG